MIPVFIVGFLGLLRIVAVTIPVGSKRKSEDEQLGQRSKRTQLHNNHASVSPMPVFVEAIPLVRVSTATGTFVAVYTVASITAKIPLDLL